MEKKRTSTPEREKANETASENLAQEIAQQIKKKTKKTKDLASAATVDANTKTKVQESKERCGVWRS